MLDSTCGSFFTLRGAEVVALRFFAVPPSNVARHTVPQHLRHVTLPSLGKNKYSSWPGLLGSAREAAGFVRWRSLCGARDTLSDHFTCDNKPTNITGGAILNENKHVASPTKPSSLHNGNRWADARNNVRFDENGEYRVYQELLEGKKTRFVSRVMYDGTNYHGFQLQINGRRTVQNSVTTLEQMPSHVQLFEPLSQSTSCSANTDLTKDVIRRRLAHARRRHKPEEDGHVAVAGWAFVYVASVALVESLQKRTEFKEVLEKTLSQRFQTHVPVVGAGRTDAGVHAIGQAVHFDLPNADEDLGQLTYSMNQMMPPDIRVWNMAIAPPSSPSQAERGLPWSAMLNARSKMYSYRLFVGKIPSPLERLYRAHASHAARSPVDVERIQRAIHLFVGEHDFAGFSNEVEKRGALRRAEGFAEFNTRRTVYSAEFVDEGDGNVRLDFHLNGALYRMVRNMVGTLLAIGAGRFEPEVIEEIFMTGVRDSDRIFPAPAHGLTLKTVYYDGYT